MSVVHSSSEMAVTLMPGAVHHPLALHASSSAEMCLVSSSSVQRPAQPCPKIRLKICRSSRIVSNFRHKSYRLVGARRARPAGAVGRDPAGALAVVQHSVVRRRASTKASCGVGSWSWAVVCSAYQVEAWSIGPIIHHGEAGGSP